MHLLISFRIVISTVTIRLMGGHLVLRPSFSLFQLILAQRMAQVAFTKRCASPKDVQALFPFQFVIVSKSLVDLPIVPRFGVVHLQFVSGLKLCTDFGLHFATTDRALAIARMN